MPTTNRSRPFMQKMGIECSTACHIPMVQPGGGLNVQLDEEGNSHGLLTAYFVVLRQIHSGLDGGSMG